MLDGRLPEPVTEGRSSDVLMYGVDVRRTTGRLDKRLLDDEDSKLTASLDARVGSELGSTVDDVYGTSTRESTPSIVLTASLDARVGSELGSTVVDVYGTSTRESTPSIVKGTVVTAVITDTSPPTELGKRSSSVALALGGGCEDDSSAGVGRTVGVRLSAGDILREGARVEVGVAVTWETCDVVAMVDGRSKDREGSKLGNTGTAEMETKLTN